MKSISLSPFVQEDIRTIFSVYFEKHTHFEERQREKSKNILLRCMEVLNATMPESQRFIMMRLPLPHVMLFFELCLRGIGQVVFQNNPLSGLIILVALVVQSGRVALHGVIGLIVGNLIAYALGFDKGLKRSGLFGYNSF